MLLLRTYILLLLGLLFPLLCVAQGWEKTYGGTAADAASQLLSSPDGGFYVIGNTASFGNGDQDIYLIKTDANGNLEWSKALGDTLSFEYGRSIDLSADSSSLIIGGTAVRGDTVQMYLQKTDLLGNTIWSMTSSDDSLAGRFVLEQQSGEVLICGNRQSTKVDSTGISFIDTDLHLLKTDANGQELWSKSFGGDRPEDGFAMVAGTNNNVLVAGYTRSFGHGGYDIYLTNINTNDGSEIWTKTYGGSKEDLGYDIKGTSDEGFIITGQKDESTASNENVFLLKLNSLGEEEWFETYQLPGLETGRAVTESNDGGFLIAGESRQQSNSNRDALLIKTNTTGNLLWSHTYGGLLGDGVVSVEQCPQGGIALAGYTFSFGAGSSDAYFIKTDSAGLSFSCTVYGNVFTDGNLDCALNNQEPGIPGWILSAQGSTTRYAATDSLGNYTFRLDTGQYLIRLWPPNSYWMPCDDSMAIQFINPFDSLSLDVPVQAEIECPLLSVDISTPFLRRCFPNTYSVYYCNSGTQSAVDATIEVSFDEFIQVDSSDLSYTSNGNVFTFEIGNLDLFDCGRFNIYTTLSCDSTIVGQTHCVEAHIFPDTICQPIDPNWDGSSVEVRGQCNGDSVIFTISNVGQGDMDEPLKYLIIEDHIMLRIGDFELSAFEDTTFVYVPNGGTIRLEAEQSTGHPGYNDPSVSIEGCGSFPFPTGFVIQLPQNDGNPFMDIDCQESIGSFDPNDKLAFPKGFAAEHFIEPNTDIEYLIRFQNTGSDTAFTVVIRDTLSYLLDITTVRAGSGSHAYDFKVYDERILQFTFNNIQLPDSSVNELGSHGFIKFKVAQIADNAIGQHIYNQAGIYFDFNPPVITNTTDHLVGINFIQIDTTTVGVFNPELLRNDLRVYPNPFTEFVNFEIPEESSSDNDTLLFSLYDLQGRLIRQEQFTRGKFTLQRKNLATGIYLFRIEHKDILMSSGKVILGK